MHTESFTMAVLHSFCTKESVACECHSQIMGLIFLSLDEHRHPLSLQISGNEQDQQRESRKEKGAASVNCRLQKAGKGGEEKHKVDEM